LLLILVPRHPQRFDSVAAAVERTGLKYVRRSLAETCSEDTAVFLGDTLGELPVFYAASDAAFVGGSLVRVGGHNLLEPAAVSLPIVSGPYNFNAEDIAEMLDAAGALAVVEDERGLEDEIASCLASPDLSRQRGQAGRRILDENRGALDRLLRLVIPLMDGGEEEPASLSAVR
jgi:3-deoxy-D-manno-octulosonic-acid transferase